MKVVHLVRYAPLAAVMAAVGLDGLGVLLDQPLSWEIGARLATIGIVAVLLAALFVFVSDFYRAPGIGRSRGRAVRQLALDLVIVLLLALARLFRGHPAVQPDLPLIALQVVALILLVASRLRVRSG